GGTEAENFEHGVRTAAERGLFGFEHPHGGAFTGRGAVASSTERPNGTRRGREAEFTEAERGFFANFLHATGEEVFGAAKTKEVGRVAHRVETGGESGADGGVDSAEPVFDGGLSGRGVDDGVGELHWADPGGAFRNAGPVERCDAVHAPEQSTD